MAAKVVFDEQGARRIVAAVKSVERQGADLSGDPLGKGERTYPSSIVAKLTAQDGTDLFRWAWTEQEWDAVAKAWVDRPNGRSGTTTDRPAIELNLETSSSVGDVVTLVRRAGRQADDSTKLVWGFQSKTADPETVDVTVVADFRVDTVTNKLQVKYQTITVIAATDPTDWTDAHTGIECTLPGGG